MPRGKKQKRELTPLEDPNRLVFNPATLARTDRMAALAREGKTQTAIYNQLEHEKDVALSKATTRKEKEDARSGLRKQDVLKLAKYLVAREKAAALFRSNPKATPANVERQIPISRTVKANKYSYVYVASYIDRSGRSVEQGLTVNNDEILTEEQARTKAERILKTSKGDSGMSKGAKIDVLDLMGVVRRQEDNADIIEQSRVSTQYYQQRRAENERRRAQENRKKGRR